MITVLLASLVIFIGAFVQTSIGFGLAIVSAPLLFFLDPAYVPVPITLATLANVIFGSWHFRAHLSLRGLLPAVIARLPGSFVGAGLLLLASVQSLAVLIAIVIVVGMTANYVRFRIPINPYTLATAGFLSGVMGTATSIGGPPMAILMQGQQANAIRGNLAAFFLFSSLVSLVILFPTDYLGGRQLAMALPLVPASWCGSYVASRMSHRINEKWMAAGTLLLCAVAVTAMLAQHFFTGHQ